MKQGKFCKSCNKKFEATLENFEESDLSKDGFTSQCRTCIEGIRINSVVHKKNKSIGDYELIGMNGIDELYN